MIISRIRRDHVRDGFDSGDAELDDYLRRFARQNDERGIAVTYVATRDDELDVLAYVTIRVGEVAHEELSEEKAKRLPRYPVPVVHLARLAVDRSVQGQRLGEKLLVFALRKVREVAEEVGVRAVEVLAKNEPAREFYRKYGFEELADDRLHLYLSMKTVRRLLDPS
mgnify:CR=1 FL=1